MDLAKKVMNGVRVTSEDLLHYRKRRRRYQEDLQAQLYSEKGLNFYFSVSKIIWRGEVRPNGKKAFFRAKRDQISKFCKGDARPIHLLFVCICFERGEVLQ